MTTIDTLRLRLSNAHVVRGDRPVLVDAGAPGDGRRIAQGLRRRGIDPAEVALVVLTHGHADHAGGAAEVRDLTGAPIALHPADAPMAARGRNDPLRPTGTAGRVLRPLVDPPFPPFRGDIALDGTLDLRPYGVAGRVEPLPGHTPGSVVVLLDSGDALVGDLVRGGYVAGAIRPSLPLEHYYAQDRAAVRAALEHVLALGVDRLFVGHGGPVAARDVRRRLDRVAPAPPEAPAPAGLERQPERRPALRAAPAPAGPEARPGRRAGGRVAAR